MKYFFYIAIFSIMILPLSQVFAIQDAAKEDVIGGLNNTMGEAGLMEQIKSVEEATAEKTAEEVSSLLGRIIRIAVLAVVGVIFLYTTIQAGFVWLTSGGNEEKISKAKNMITSAAIGMLLILGAYAITWFVVSTIAGKTITDNPSIAPSEELMGPPAP